QQLPQQPLLLREPVNDALPARSPFEFARDGQCHQDCAEDARNRSAFRKYVFPRIRKTPIWATMPGPVKRYSKEKNGQREKRDVHAPRGKPLPQLEPFEPQRSAHQASSGIPAGTSRL